MVFGRSSRFDIVILQLDHVCVTQGHTCQYRCDRILWHGDGIEQLQYLRGESRFSDHRPVCGVFAVEVDTDDGSKIKRGYYSVNARMGHDKPA